MRDNEREIRTETESKRGREKVREREGQRQRVSGREGQRQRVS